MTVSSRIVKKYRYNQGTLCLENFIGFIYRRFLVKPKLPLEQKASRLVWCLYNKNNNFEKFIYAYESTTRLNEYLRYHLRLPSKNLEELKVEINILKINIFGAKS